MTSVMVTSTAKSLVTRVRPLTMFGLKPLRASLDRRNNLSQNLQWDWKPEKNLRRYYTPLANYLHQSRLDEHRQGIITIISQISLYLQLASEFESLFKLLLTCLLCTPVPRIFEARRISQWPVGRGEFGDMGLPVFPFSQNVMRARGNSNLPLLSGARRNEWQTQSDGAEVEEGFSRSLVAIIRWWATGVCVVVVLVCNILNLQLHQLTDTTCANYFKQGFMGNQRQQLSTGFSHFLVMLFSPEENSGKWQWWSQVFGRLMVQKEA